MARPPSGAPPVDRSSAVAPANAQAEAQTRYLMIVDAFKQNSASVRAIKSMLGGDKKSVERFLAVVFSSLRGDSDLLLNATPLSIIQAVKDAADLGLEPTGLNGEGAIVRYGTQATFLPMYRGYLKRIRNSGAVDGVDVQLVYSEDEFRLELGTNPAVFHVPAILETTDDGEIVTPRGAYKGAYAWALLRNGFRLVEWMPTADIEYVRKTFARESPKSPWRTSWGEMARKTVLRRLAKRLAQESVDLQKLLAVETRADQMAASETGNGKGGSEALSNARAAALAATTGSGAAVAVIEPPDASAASTEDAGKEDEVADGEAKPGDGVANTVEPVTENTVKAVVEPAVEMPPPQDIPW